eukprot:EG_transcript_5100
MTTMMQPAHLMQEAGAADAQLQVPQPTVDVGTDTSDSASLPAEEPFPLQAGLLPSPPALDPPPVGHGHWSDYDFPPAYGYGFRRPHTPPPRGYGPWGWRAPGQPPPYHAGYPPRYEYWSRAGMPGTGGGYYQNWQQPLPYGSPPPYPGHRPAYPAPSSSHYPRSPPPSQRPYARPTFGTGDATPPPPASPAEYDADHSEYPEWSPAPSESSHTHELWAADDSGAISDTSPVESPRQDPGDEQSESPRKVRFRATHPRGSVPDSDARDGELPQPPSQHQAASKAAQSRPTPPPRTVRQQVKGILNRITPATYPQLQGQLLCLADGLEGSALEETLNEIAKSIHTQAITVPMYGKLYAELCANVHSREQKRLADDLQAGRRVVAFRRALLNACQEFFEKPPQLPNNFDELSVEKKEEEEGRLKRQKIGNMKLIAELFKGGLLSERLIELILQKLLWGGNFNGWHQPTELEIVLACTLLEEVGQRLGHDRAVASFRQRLEQLRDLASEQRIKFRLENTLDKWVARADLPPSA